MSLVGAGAGAAGAAALHPDLQDLAWGGASSSNLQPPMNPSGQGATTDAYTNRGSLSDFSDYQSSDEETHNRAGPSNAAQSRRRGYVDVSDNESSQDVRRDPKQGLLQEEDPFADPFAD